MPEAASYDATTAGGVPGSCRRRNASNAIASGSGSMKIGSKNWLRMSVSIASAGIFVGFSVPGWMRYGTRMDNRLPPIDRITSVATI